MNKPSQSHNSSVSNELLPHHHGLWQQLETMLAKEHLPHALLLVGPQHAMLERLANRLIAKLQCQQPLSPCGHCQACHLFMHDLHPDVRRIRPDEAGQIIKVEQIRALHTAIYQTAQFGGWQVLVLEPADKLNMAAANALLKILEEPPPQVIFILLVENLNVLPATILSRCQIYTAGVPEFPNEQIFPYLALGQFYPETTPRGSVFAEREAILTALCALVAGKTTPCAIVNRWTNLPFAELVWLLYLVIAETIRYGFSLDESEAEKNVNATDWINDKLKLKYLATQLSLRTLLKLVDKLNVFQRQIQKNIALNATLALEVLLLGFIAGE